MNTREQAPKAVCTQANLPGFLPSDLAQALAGARRCTTHWAGCTSVWHVWGQAGRPCVVLLHGGSGSWTHWVRNIAPLHAAGWHVLVPDLPGFGDSDLPLGGSDANHQLAHLHAGLAQLQAPGPVSLVGFSFGGMAAALWLAAYPQDAQQLVLVGAPGMGITAPERLRLKGWRHLLSQSAQADIHRHNLMALMLHKAESLDALALALHSANVQRDRMTRRRLSSTDIVAQTLPLLQVPVSAIYGEEDVLYRGRLPELRAAMTRLTPQFDRWLALPETGHWVQYEAPALFNAALQDLLQN